MFIIDELAMYNCPKGMNKVVLYCIVLYWCPPGQHKNCDSSPGHVISVSMCSLVTTVPDVLYYGARDRIY